MGYDKFVDIVKETKFFPRHTGSDEVKVKTNKEHTRQTIYKDFKCKSCGTHISQKVIVYFKKYHQLTIFEAHLLFYLFILKKKPMDYGNYHRCIAGKEFIANIDDVVV